MPQLFLPSSAKAFAPRDKPHIVLNPKYSESLAKVLQKAKPKNYQIRRRKDSSRQAALLSILLAFDTAIWIICETDLWRGLYDVRQANGPPPASLPKSCDIQAHVIHVDMISRNEMSFKLTSETIQALIEFYDKNILCPLNSSISNGSQKITAPHHKDPKQEFVQKLNEFVFCTSVSALESLRSDGTGFLIGRQAMAAREAIDNVLVSVMHPQQECGLWQQGRSIWYQDSSLLQGSLLPTQERGRIDWSNSHSSFKPWGFEEDLPDMTIPYLPLTHTVYADQSFSFGAVWGNLPLLSRDGQQLPPPYAQSSSRSPLLQWPSIIAGDTRGMGEIDEAGRYSLSG